MTAVPSSDVSAGASEAAGAAGAPGVGADAVPFGGASTTAVPTGVAPSPVRRRTSRTGVMEMSVGAIRPPIASTCAPAGRPLHCRVRGASCRARLVNQHRLFELEGRLRAARQLGLFTCVSIGATVIAAGKMTMPSAIALAPSSKLLTTDGLTNLRARAPPAPTVTASRCPGALLAAAHEHPRGA